MKYRSSRIQYEVRSMSIDYLIRMVDIGRLDPDPVVGAVSFQSNEKQSRIIESLLLGLPPEMIWAEQNDLGRNQLLSSFNTVSSILNFENDEFSLKGTRLLKDLEGVYFSELGFSEKKNLMKMEVGFSVIYPDSEPLRKFVFIESLNNEKGRVISSQLSRTIVFKKSGRYIMDFIDHVLDVFEVYLGGKRFLRRDYFLNVQRQILLCILFLYISRKPDLISSHYSNVTDEMYFDISFHDDLEMALSKIMLLMEDSYYERRISVDFFFDEIIFYLKKGSEYEDVVEIFHRSLNNTLCLFEFFVSSFNGVKVELKSKPNQTVSSFMDRVL